MFCSILLIRRLIATSFGVNFNLFLQCGYLCDCGVSWLYARIFFLLAAADQLNVTKLFVHNSTLKYRVALDTFVCLFELILTSLSISLNQGPLDLRLSTLPARSHSCSRVFHCIPLLVWLVCDSVISCHFKLTEHEIDTAHRC